MIIYLLVLTTDGMRINIGTFAKKEDALKYIKTKTKKDSFNYKNFKYEIEKHTLNAEKLIKGEEEKIEN